MPPHFAAAAKNTRYNARVFLAPDWDEIFTQDVNERSRLTWFQRLNLTHLYGAKLPGGPPSYSESVWGLCLRDVYVFLRRLLCANRYDVLPVSLIAQ